jgi:hypothetical protein
VALDDEASRDQRPWAVAKRLRLLEGAILAGASEALEREHELYWSQARISCAILIPGIKPYRRWAAPRNPAPAATLL